MNDVRSLAAVLAVIGISMIISGAFTLSYIIHQTDIIDGYVNKINKLETEKEELKRDYNYEKKQAEYWYYYNVTDAC